MFSPTTASDFSSVWNITNRCLIIHTHGSSQGLADHGDEISLRIISLDEIKALNSNNKINFIMMTACETAGGNENDNVAYWLSKKINPGGIVIANKYKVSGNDTTFYASGKIPGWVAYKNGVIVRRENAIPIVLTMADAYQIYTELTNTD